MAAGLLDDFRQFPITNGQPVDIEQLCELLNGSEAIHSITIINISSFSVYISINSQRNLGTNGSIQIVGGGSITLAIGGGATEIFVSSNGVQTSTMSGFVYIHWTNQTLTAYSANLTISNVVVTNAPNVNAIPNPPANPFDFHVLDTAGTNLAAVTTVATGHKLYITDMVFSLETFTANAFPNGSAFEAELRISSTNALLVQLLQQTGVVAANALIAATLQAHFNSPLIITGPDTLEYGFTDPNGTSFANNITITGYTI